MEAIVLAGGFGTRLRHVVEDIPKPMAPINCEPFLKYILEYLLSNEITEVILAVGYKAEYIQEYFADDYKGLHIIYSKESFPLGTGGAIKKALDSCKEKDVFILNGDTYFDVDLQAMKVFHELHSSKITIAVKEMENFDRYGSVVIENNIVKEFTEKKPTEHGIINGGIYLLNKEIVYDISDKCFSFENKILENPNIDIYAYESRGYLIDIGVPNDYYKAQKDLKKSRFAMDCE